MLAGVRGHKKCQVRINRSGGANPLELDLIAMMVSLVERAPARDIQLIAPEV